MIKFKVNPLICCWGIGGTGPGDGPDGPGFGGPGAGSSGSGSGGSSGPGSGGADPVGSGDPTSQGFGGTVVGGSVGEGGQGPGQSAQLGHDIGQAVLAGNMTVSQANDALSAIGSQNSGLSGIIGQGVATAGAILGGMPGELGTAASFIGMPVTTAAALAGFASAITGQPGLGAGSGDGVGDQGGPGGVEYWTNLIQQGQAFADEIGTSLQDSGGNNMTAEATDPRERFQWTPTGQRDEVAGQQDLLSDLTRQAQSLTGRSITATVGGQPLTVMPRSNQDQLNMILGHLFTNQKLSELEHQFDQTMDYNKESFVNTFIEDSRQFDEALAQGAFQFKEQNTPSTVDKASQLLGLGSDALNLWDTIGSLI